MSKSLKPRRGTTAEQNAFIGAAYEITYDTDKNTIVCRDGVTPGGFPLAQEEQISMLRALIQQELEKKLNKSGGTLTGAIRQTVGDILVAERDDMWTSIKGGSAHDHGATLVLYGQDQADGAGNAVLQAFKDGVGRTNFEVRPNGTAFINNIPVLSSAGGMMSGAIYSNSVALVGTDKTNYLAIAANEGASATINLFGHDRADGYAGVAELVAFKNSLRSSFALFPDGSANINGHRVITLEDVGDGYLRYSNGIQITMQSLTVTSSGDTYSLPIPFGGTGYFFMTSILGFSNGDHSITCQAIDGASFKARSNGANLGCQVVCIGYWK